MEDNTLLMIAGLGIGGYLLYKYLMENSVIAQAAGTIGGAAGYVNTAADTIGLTTTDKIASVISPPLAGLNVATKMGGTIGMTPTDVLASIISPPLGLANVLTKAFNQSSLSASDKAGLMSTNPKVVAVAKQVVTASLTTPVSQQSSYVQTATKQASLVIKKSPLTTNTQKFAAVLATSPVTQSPSARTVLSLMMRR